MKYSFFVLMGLFMVTAPNVFATGQFAADGCVHCGGELKEYEVEISESDKIIFCKTHEAGAVEVGREHGVRVFGSLEAYFENLHRIQCPPFYPSPHYFSIKNAVFERELMRDLDYIQEFLSDEERAYFLNRQGTGPEKYTLLDLAYVGEATSWTPTAVRNNENLSERF